MTESDLAAVTKLEGEIFPDPWPVESFADVLQVEGWYALVAQHDRQIIGYGILNTVVDEAHLANIAVAAPYRQKSVAAAILTRLIAIAVEQSCTVMLLEVRESNAAARAFYERHGFVQAYVRRGYYAHPPEHALVLTRQLEER